ncbi:MAG: amidohydrolase family protein [Pseudomonadota bacterium]
MGEDYFVVDTHVHLYRNARQGWLGRAIYDRIDKGGTLEQLLRYMEEAGVDQAWVINAWPTQGLLQAGVARLSDSLSGGALEKAKAEVKADVGAKLSRANDWLCSTSTIAPGKVVPLIALDPFLGSEWMVKDIEDKYRKGARGVKIIATWGEFYPNDRALWPAYETLAGLGMVVVAHSGGSNVLFEVKGTDYASPRYWDEPLSQFPNLKVVLAHLGYHWMFGYGEQEQKERLDLVRKYPNVYFDLSQNNEFGYSTFEEEMIREIGVDRVLWASDWHAHRAIMSLEGLKNCGLTEEEKRKILGGNARRLMGA